MPALEESRPSVGVALDIDLERRPDALLALAMLHGLTVQGAASRISLAISRPSLHAARLADVVAEFYSTLPLNAGFATIGMPEGPVPSPDAPALAALLSRTGADGKLLYPSSVQRLVDTAESGVLLRNMLLAQPDGSAAVVLAGPATGLVRALDLYGARQQLASKCSQLLLAAGAFAGGPAERSLAGNVAAARRLLAEWPTPIVAVGAEVGAGLRYPTAQLETGLAWAATHPVLAAHRALQSQDPPTTALAALHYAAHPTSGCFELSAPGTITVLDDGSTRFTPGASGRHRYLIADPSQRESLLATYVSLVSLAPAPRPVRFRPPPNAQAPAAPTPGAPAPAAAPPAGAVPTGAKP